MAEATYREAIDLARESGQQTELTFGLAGLAWLQARRGREQDCRDCAAEALQLCQDLGMRLHQIWATTALGELELGLGDAAQRGGPLRANSSSYCGTSRSPTSTCRPAAELVDAYLRLGRPEAAQHVAAQFLAGARAKGQPWSLARALRGEGLLAGGRRIRGAFRGGA